MELFDFLWPYGVVIFRLFGVIVVLMTIIFVHEMGHYLVGRWCGIGASAFSLGFGPELCGYTDKRGTRWKLAAIPLGGYVKFIGDEDPASMPSGKMQTLRKDAFALANAWKRAATVFAGPLFNGIFTVLILAFMAFVFGRIILIPIVTDVVENSPAARAGFQTGDKFLTMQGAKVQSFDDIPRYVMMHDGDVVHFTVERDGKPVEISVVPETRSVDDGLGNTIRVGQIGVQGANAAQNIRKIEYSLWGALEQGVDESVFIVQQTGRFLARMVQGRADRCQLSGPVRSAEIVWKVSDYGFFALLRLTAFFSLSIGLFNLLPIPPLDGGHLVFYLVEGIIGRPVPLRVQEAVFRVGIFVVFGFIVFAVVNNFVPC